MTTSAFIGTYVVGFPQLPLNEQVADDSGLIISLLRRHRFRYAS
jgi:hypothetical protein